MLLAVDIGNTNITFGLFKNKQLLKKFNLPTQPKRYSFLLKKRLLKKNFIKDIVVCSVVPEVLAVLTKDFKKIFFKDPLIIGQDLKVPLKNLYRYPQQVGKDRLVNAFGGLSLYGCPLIVVDFGTAVTFDIVSKNKQYLGGMILPGLNMSLDALAKGTALLPKIKLKNPKEFIGRDTQSSMLSGLIYGFSCLVDSLVEQIKKKIGRNAKVIATGGDSALMNKYCSKIDKLDIDLTLKGINLVYLLSKP